MFKRKIIQSLQKWSSQPKRKPLIIRGARQVGKTSVVSMFADEFDQFIYLNLEKREDKNLFERGLPVNDIYQAVLLKANKRHVQNKTLLFIDEIQNSPEAVASLRYFYEDLSDLHVIAAGSLLEVRISEKDINFPVGRVEFLYMYPLSFQEYLTAIKEDQSAELLHEIPFKEYALETLVHHFHKYVLLGGMPEVIEHYSLTKDIASLGPIYHSLMTTYQEDAEKYTKGNKKIIRHCIETAPLEAGSRIRFEGFGESNYKSRDISQSLRALEQAMLLYLIYPTTSLEVPPRRDFKKSPRLQFLDTGLINFTARLQHNYYSFHDLHGFYRGILAEHIVGQELLACSQYNEKPFFWVREKKQSVAEVDYLVQYKRFLIPVEVKSGKAGRLRSLHQFIDRCSHAYAVRLYAGPFLLSKETTLSGKSFFLLNLPYFLASKLPDYLDWMMEKTA